MSKRISDLLLANVEKFHSDNLYIPTRTIYFGGTGFDYENTEDEVNCRTIAQFVKNLHILEHKDSKPISVLLNTPGGSWEDGMAVYDLMKKLKSTVTIIGMGKLYSMGSIIFQGADKRILMENTSIMIHDGNDGFIGDAKSFERWAENSKTVRNSMYKIYYSQIKNKKPRITLKDIEDMCSHDTIFTAKEAVKIGLADRIM